jgi:hypothetical protein
MTIAEKINGFVFSFAEQSLPPNFYNPDRNRVFSPEVSGLLNPR